MKIIKNTNYMLLSLFLFLNSCGQKRDELGFCTWETSLEVKYSDNTKDTILNTVTLSKKLSPLFEIKTKEKGFFSDTEIVPCLVVKEKDIMRALM